MNEIEFDTAFSRFLNEEQYEKTNEAMYSLIRAAFSAGWRAAMGSDLKRIIDIDRR